MERKMTRRMRAASVATGVLSLVGTAFGADTLVTTTAQEHWRDCSTEIVDGVVENAMRLAVDTGRTDQTIIGFGVCMSELSHDALTVLPAEERKAVFDEMYSPEGGAFTVLRTPIGASDFARDFYSYAETPDDFEMEHFSIARDEKGLLPLIREAQSRVPADALKIWASPWCPPAWMKTNGKAESCPDTVNDLKPEDRIFEGEDGFICDDRYFRAYALYFRKYVEAYRAAGVPLWMVMPQNEFNSDQNFPSCTWSAGQLAKFIGKYLGPALEGSGVELYFGTMERPNAALLAPVLERPAYAKYVKGAAFQWAGAGAIGAVRAKHPELTLIMSEQECGDGRNDWGHAMHCWDLMCHYLGNGVSIYDYWNMALKKDGLSHWGWRQNSLVVVDAEKRTWSWSHEYYVLKHLSRYVRRGAKRIMLDGDPRAAMAFVNPDGSVVVALRNPASALSRVTVCAKGRSRTVALPADSVSTFVME